MMDSKTQAKLDLAVQRYVESLDLDSICELARYNVRSYYQNCPTNAEMYEFMDEMKVTDASIKGETK
jgi:cyanate lyase